MLMKDLTDEICERTGKKISEDEIFNNLHKNNSRTLYYLGQSYFDIQKWEDAIKWFTKRLLFLENTDEVSYLLNNEIIMIPSSPTITFEQQQTVVNSVYGFILFNQNIKVVKIQKENSNLLDDFIPTINSKYFRYFSKRTSDCIKDHLYTFLFYDISCNIYFGYTHIDFYEKHWFGIYIDDNYRNKKLGNLLLNYTLNCCKINNISDIYLSVDSDNEIAIRLYKKNNFIVNDVNGNITYMAKTL
jgi:GNAT superfamily N-acetyltransferase